MARNNSSAAYRRPLPAHGLLATLALAFAIGIQLTLIADDTDAITPLTADELRVNAANELQRAHEMVDQARLRAEAAKIQLDEFITRHFEEHQLHGAAPPPQFGRPQPAPNRLVDPPVNPRKEQLTQQLNDLKARREEMLTRLMPAHPDVAQLDEQIAELSKRVASERPLADEPSPPAVAEGANVFDSKLADHLNSEKLRHQQAASMYEELVSRCQIAERAVQVAMDAEHKAGERLAEIRIPAPPVAAAEPAAAPPPAPPPQPRPTPTTMPAPPAPSQVVHVQQQSSQPLALVVLLVALAIAALAAVRLARSSNDAAFANAAEASAVLALPVVGIIPAAEVADREEPTAYPVRRGTLLLAEIVLAVLVFASVACLVGDPSFLWQLCTDPQNGFGELMRFFGAN